MSEPEIIHRRPAPFSTGHLEAAAFAADAAHRNMRMAHVDERIAQADALNALLYAVAPALPALVSPFSIDLGDEAPLVKGNFYRLGVPTHADRKGLSALYVDAAGMLWWRDPESRAWSEVTVEVATRCAVWPIEAWVGQLAMSCEAVANGRAKRGTTAAKRRAAKLRALAVLLDTSSEG